MLVVKVDGLLSLVCRRLSKTIYKIGGDLGSRVFVHIGVILNVSFYYFFACGACSLLSPSKSLKYLLLAKSDFGIVAQCTMAGEKAR